MSLSKLEARLARLEEKQSKPLQPVRMYFIDEGDPQPELGSEYLNIVVTFVSVPQPRQTLRGNNAAAAPQAPPDVPSGADTRGNYCDIGQYMRNRVKPINT